MRPAATGLVALAAGAALLLGGCSTPATTTVLPVVTAPATSPSALTPAPGWTLIATARPMAGGTPAAPAGAESGGGGASADGSCSGIDGGDSSGSGDRGSGASTGASKSGACRLRLHAAPTGPVVRTLTAAPGQPLALMVLDTRPGWLHVQLPERPNQSTAWVAQDDVEVTSTPYRLVVSESAHRLDVLRAGRVVERHPVGVGKAATPTVRGTFFVTELLVPPDPHGSYGPFAFGLSAHSDVLTSFAGGDGQLGLHGTDQPGLVGRDVSHGCLRVTNDVVTHLASFVPLGTPVEIRA